MKSIPLTNGRKIDLARPIVMGIINATPDSFAIHCDTTESAVDLARQMIDEGAAIIDVGGESSRPGSDPVEAGEELARILPVIEKIRTFSGIPISIDTTRASVAEKALTQGANIINDISALASDPGMADVAVRFECPIVLMHIKGKPKTMQDSPHYDDVISEVTDYFEKRIDYALSCGIAREKLILDVGLGFGKRTEDNLKLLGHLSHFALFGLPLLVGASRKRFIGELTETDGDDRIDGSLAAAALAVTAGADIIRAHDVAQTRHAVALAAAVREA